MRERVYRVEPAGTTPHVIAGLFKGLAAGEQARIALVSAGFERVDIDGANGAETVVSVEAGSEAIRAIAILEQHGAEIGDAVAIDGDVAAEDSVQLRAERLRFERRIEASEARIRREIVTEMVSIAIPVQREVLVIEQDDRETLRIPLTEERVGLVKETVVREQVRIGTRRVDDVVHVRENLRHERLRTVETMSEPAQHQQHTISNEEWNTMNTTDTSDLAEPGSGTPGTIAATFPDRASAHDALADLHDAGFRNVWLGVTHFDATTSNDVTVSSEETDGGVMGSIGRFFSGEGTHEQALHQALTAHGLTHDQAQQLEATVPVGAAIVTVAAENDPAEALEILETYGGTIATNVVTNDPVTERLDVDAARRLELREERLLVDKQRISAGEARIGKDVVSEQQSVRVPVFHEELFIERRPVNETIATSTIPLDGSEEIRVPLSAERLDVQKVTVVTEQVDIGTRVVGDVAHVDETLRREELRVDDGKAVTDSTTTSL